MLCCVGLIGGMAVGQSMGGPWIYIAPAAGFGIGLMGDMTFMKGMHKRGDQQDTKIRIKKGTAPLRGTEADDTNAPRELQQFGKI